MNIEILNFGRSPRENKQKTRMRIVLMFLQVKTFLFSKKEEKEYI